MSVATEDTKTTDSNITFTQSKTPGKKTDLKALADSLGLPFLDTVPTGFSKAVLGAISQDASKKYGIVPYKKEKDLLYVYMLDPENF